MPPRRLSPGCEAREMLVACEHRDSLSFVIRFELINYTIASCTNDGLVHSTQDTLKRTGPRLRVKGDSSAQRMERRNRVLSDFSKEGWGAAPLEECLPSMQEPVVSIARMP